MGGLVYGTAAHVLESDDTHQPSSTHPGAVVFSTLLPLALTTQVRWEDFVGAAVVGYEVMARIGEAVGPGAEYRRGFHPTGTVGPFGAAAAASLLLGGDSRQVGTALGIAGSMSSGSMAFLTDGSWTKHLHPGWSAHSGIVAARLALDGYRAPARVLERPHGYFAGHSDTGATGAVVEGLGTRPYAVERTSTKAHGCCRYEQAAVDAILELRRRHRIDPGQVDTVRIGVLSAAWDLIAAPAQRKRRPSGTVEAQFSMPFGAGVALLHGRASIHEHTDEAVNDPRLQEIMDRVECFLDPSLDADYPSKWPALVEVRMKDGSSTALRVDHPKGDPESPFTTDELSSRLHTLAPDLPETIRIGVVDAIQMLSGETGFVALGDALAAAWQVI